MPKKLLFILFFLLSNFLFAQEWTEPVNISNMDGTDYLSDIAVGPDGTLHCVWVHYYSTLNRGIFYSNSSNEGLNWSTPVNISQNDTLVCLMPHIVVDSKKNIYVSYEYNAYSSPIVVIQKYDGKTWGKMDTVAQGYSHKNRLFIDNNDRVYVFWLTNPNTYYRIYENNSWGEIICPYNDVNNNLILTGEVDAANNIHFIGVYDKYVSYYKYDKSIEQMVQPHILSYNDAYEGEDITVDYRNYPQVVWREYSFDNNEVFHDATIYRSFNGMSWNLSEVVVEDPYSQQIVCFNKKTYIMDMEKEPGDSVSAVFYQKDIYGNWYGTKLLKSTNFNGLIELGLMNNNMLYALFDWRKDGLQHDNYIIKTKHPLSVKTLKNYKSPVLLKQNFPNPFTNNTSFSYTLNQSGHCKLTILNLKG